MPSTVIRRFEYDAARRRLQVEFVSGRHYAYLDVPPELVERMRASFSKGQFFNANVRDRFACEPERPGARGLQGG